MHHRSFGYYRPLAEYLRAVTPSSLKSRLPNSGILWMAPLYLNLYDIQLVIARRG